MPRFLITFIALGIFAFAVLEIHSGNYVSPETALTNHRDAFVVKQGVSPNGDLAITLVPAALIPHVPLYAKVPNHNRTLRVFIAENRGGGTALYIEKSKPRSFFVLSGSFSVSPDTVSFMWLDSMSLLFYGTATGGTPMRYTVNLSDLLLKSEAIPELPTANPEYHEPLTQ